MKHQLRPSDAGPPASQHYKIGLPPPSPGHGCFSCASPSNVHSTVNFACRPAQFSVHPDTAALRSTTLICALPGFTMVVTGFIRCAFRKITTQVLVVFILLSLLLMGGALPRSLIGVLLIGLISGTYSSLFIGIPLPVSWQRGELPLLSRSLTAEAA